MTQRNAALPVASLDPILAEALEEEQINEIAHRVHAVSQAKTPE